MKRVLISIRDWSGQTLAAGADAMLINSPIDDPLAWMGSFQLPREVQVNVRQRFALEIADGPSGEVMLIPLAPSEDLHMQQLAFYFVGASN